MSTKKRTRTTEPSEPVTEEAKPEKTPDATEQAKELFRLLKACAGTSSGGEAKTTTPQFVVENIGWKAKYFVPVDEDQDDVGSIDLVDFPMWAVWFQKRRGQAMLPVVEPVVPADDEGNFEFGSELDGYCGFQEPNAEEDDSDDEPGDDDDEPVDDDDDDDDDDEEPNDDDDDDDDDNPIDDAVDEDVIDAEGVVVEDGEPAGRMRG